MERRNFIVSGLGAAGAAAIGKSKNIVRGFTNTALGSSVYLMQSGNVRTDDVAMWGVLNIGFAAKTENVLKAIKAEQKFNSTISYRSNNRFKETVCKAFVDVFATGKGTLHVKLIDYASNRFANRNPSERQSLQIDYLEELLSDVSTATSIKVKSQTEYGPSKYFTQRFENTTGMSYEAVRIQEDNILQLTDFLVGSLLSIHKGSVNDPLKLRLNEYVKGKFGIGALTAGQSYGNKIFII